MSMRFEEYKDRVHFKGNTKREYTDHDVAILSTKTTQEYEAANVIAPLSVGLDKGVLFK